MNVFARMKLGRLGVKRDVQRRLVAHRIFEMLPAPPAQCDNTNGVEAWGMMKNDQLGDCTIAGLAHSLQVASLGTGLEVTPSDNQVIAAYEKYCGYVPGNSATDQGGVEDDVLAAVKRDGFAGAKLIDYVSPDPRNIDHVKKAINYFGSVYVGAELPLSAKSGSKWDVVSGVDGVPGLWGGHCMVSAQYGRKLAPFITWGTNQPATWDWWMKYVDECHVLLWDCWLRKYPTAQTMTILNMLHSLAA